MYRYGTMMLLLCCLATHVEARMYLIWDYDRSFIPAGESTPVAQFIITINSLIGITGQQQLVIPATPQGACVPLGESPESYCAEIRCPGDGTYRMHVQASWPTSHVLSPPSNAIQGTAHMTPACTWIPSIGLSLFAPPGASPNLPPPVSPCATAAYQPVIVPGPTTTTQPAPITITVGAATVQTQAPPPPAVPPPPATVRTQAPIITPRAGKPVIAAGTTGPVASATVYGGAPQQVPLQQPQVPPVLPPCP